MTSIVSLDNLRKNLSDIVSRVMYGNQTVLVQKHNKTGVVIISEKEYENLRDPRKRFASKKEWDDLFIFADRVRNRISIKDRRDFDHILDEEIKAIRQ